MLQSKQNVLGQAKKVPWIISDLRKGMRDRYITKRKTVKSHDPQNWDLYKRLRNKIDGDVKSTT